jgi:DNA invertase Pin-like site-specific DNA recombinase
MKMLIGYARVSTQDQNPELQHDALTQAGCEKIFTEKASGAQRDRPELKAALDYMRPGDTLVVWKLDRLARSLKQLIETVEGLEQRGIGFRSLTDPIDTTTSSGKLVFHIFAALAEFERSIIRDRTMAGLQSARERGRLGGRPRALSEADMAAAKALLRDPDITVEEVAERLGVAPSTLYRYLPGGRSGIDE